MNDDAVLAGLEKALQHSGGTHTLQNVGEKVAAGKAQYWQKGSAVVITELLETPQMRVLHFWLVTGELQDVIVLSEKVIAWGRRVGCKRATLAGRRGWEKVLAGSGWSPELVLMGRDISDGQGPDYHSDTDDGPRPGEPRIR